MYIAWASIEIGKDVKPIRIRDLKVSSPKTLTKGVTKAFGIGTLGHERRVQIIQINFNRLKQPKN